jgi:hypothetical protein
MLQFKIEPQLLYISTSGVKAHNVKAQYNLEFIQYKRNLNVNSSI